MNHSTIIYRYKVKYKIIQYNKMNEKMAKGYIFTPKLQIIIFTKNKYFQQTKSKSKPN